MAAETEQFAAAPLSLIASLTHSSKPAGQMIGQTDRQTVGRPAD